MKKTATKAIAAGLAVITLAAGMIGCDDNTSKPADTTTAAKMETAVATESVTDAVTTDAVTTVTDVTTEGKAQIEEDITADEVLALYDEFAHAIVKGAYSSEYDIDVLGDGYDRLTGEMLSITPSSIHIFDDDNNFSNHEHPFYSIEQEYSPDNLWNRSPETLFYIDNLPTFKHTIYTVVLNTNTSLDEKSLHEVFTNIGISKESMESMLKTFGKTKFTLTEQHISAAPNCQICSSLIGETVYEPMDITRETIQNATPAQLSALKDVLNSMIAINIYGEYPEPDKTYEIILE